MTNLTHLAFGMPGGMEWMIILLIALLIFGSRLPKIMRGLGSSVREFRSGIEDPPTQSASESPVPPVPLEQPKAP